MSRIFYEVIGIIESVNTDFHIKMDGNRVTAVRLRGRRAPFVDWSNRIPIQPKLGDIVKIVCSDWAPRRFGYHHAIQSYQALTEAELEMLKNKVKTFARAIFPYKQNLDAWLTMEDQPVSR